MTSPEAREAPCRIMGASPYDKDRGALCLTHGGRIRDCTPAAPEERGEGLDADLNADERAELELLRRNKDEDTPGPWIQRAFDALGTAKANARRIEELEAAATPAPDTGAEERPSELAAAAWLEARGGAEERLRAALIREIDKRVPPLDWPNGLADRVLAAIDAALSGGSVDEEGA